MASVVRRRRASSPPWRVQGKPQPIWRKVTRPEPARALRRVALLETCSVHVSTGCDLIMHWLHRPCKQVVSEQKSATRALDSPLFARATTPHPRPPPLRECPRWRCQTTFGGRSAAVAEYEPTAAVRDRTTKNRFIVTRFASKCLHRLDLYGRARLCDTSLKRQRRE
jgi:hypothetical protein